MPICTGLDFIMRANDGSPVLDRGIVNSRAIRMREDITARGSGGNVFHSHASYMRSHFQIMMDWSVVQLRQGRGGRGWQASIRSLVRRQQHHRQIWIICDVAGENTRGMGEIDQRMV